MYTFKNKLDYKVNDFLRQFIAYYWYGERWKVVVVVVGKKLVFLFQYVLI